MQAVSYIHIDCDLYLGAIEALTLLTDRIHPGTVIVFDELIGYPAYRQHEVKALWEWLQHSGRKVRPIGIYDDRIQTGKVGGVAEGMVMDPVGTLSVRPNLFHTHGLQHLLSSDPWIGACVRPGRLACCLDLRSSHTLRVPM
jgi:hypothetical protein